MSPRTIEQFNVTDVDENAPLSLPKLPTSMSKEENRSDGVHNKKSADKEEALIRQIRDDFSEAIRNLAQINCQLLDFSYLIALHYLDLELM